MTRTQALTEALVLAITAPKGKVAKANRLVSELAAGLSKSTIDRAKHEAREQIAKRDWEEYVRTHTLPADIPPNPDVVYAGKGWKGWADWVGL